MKIRTGIFDSIGEGGVIGGGLGAEMLGDGTMERGDLIYWPAYGSPTTREKSAADKYAGSQSLHIVVGAGVTGAQQQGIALTNGKTYRLSVYAKCVGGTAFLYSNIENLGFVVSGQTTSTDWILLTDDMVCATDVPRTVLLVGNAGSEVYFDNASLKEVL